MFVLGYLLVDTSQIEVIEAQFKKYRESFKYNGKLTYRSNDQNKQYIVNQLITNFAKSPAMRFCTKLIKVETPSEDQNVNDIQVSFGKRSLKKIEIYKELNTALKLDSSNFVIKSQSAFGPSVYFKEQFGESVKGAKMQAVNTMSSELIQLAGILTGCARAEIAQKTKNKTKLLISQHLKEVLGLKSIEIGAISNEKFKIFK